MRKVSYVILLAVIAFTACKEQDFKKGKTGLEYKIISSGSGDKVKMGEAMQIHVGQYYATGKTDSLLSDTRVNGGALMETMDSATIPEAYFEIFSQLRNHDSLVIRLLTDTAFAKSSQGMPPMFKKGHYLITTVKVMNIFKTKAESDSARTAERKMAMVKDSLKGIEMLVKDDKTIQDYLAKNKITAVKAPLGTYVQIIEPGTGNNIDTSMIVSTNYTGKTIAGVMFDSNTDSSRHHVEPYNVNMTNDRSLGQPVMKGWYDGLSLLKKGAKAKFFIPSSLAYGSRASEEIPANSILVFDIEILDILTKDQVRATNKAKIEVNRLKQKAFMDSIAKTKKAAGEPPVSSQK